MNYDLAHNLRNIFEGLRWRSTALVGLRMRLPWDLTGQIILILPHIKMGLDGGYWNYFEMVRNTMGF